MQIEYKNKSIEKICTDASHSDKKYGKETSNKIQLRMDQIRAADNFDYMIQYRVGRCHPLQGDRQNQYAVDLVHPKRLVFEKKGNDIQIVKIIEIVDYH